MISLNSKFQNPPLKRDQMNFETQILELFFDLGPQISLEG